MNLPSRFLVQRPDSGKHILGTYKGVCNKLIYNFLSENILLEGNVFVKKIETNESISGDKVKINRKTKDIEIIGNKKPVNIIIKVNE